MEQQVEPIHDTPIVKPRCLYDTCQLTIEQMEGIGRKIARTISKQIYQDEPKDYRFYSTSGWYIRTPHSYPEVEPTLQDVCRRRCYQWITEEFRERYPNMPELQVSIETMQSSLLHGEPNLTTATIYMILHKGANEAFKEAVIPASERATRDCSKLTGPGILTLDESDSDYFVMRMMTVWKGMM